MLVQITVQIDDRVVQWEKTVSGTRAEREETGHAVGKEVGRLVSEAALNEAATEVRLL